MMKPKEKRKLVVVRSSKAVKILAGVVVLFSIVALVALGWVRSSIRDLTEEKRQQAAALEQENAVLTEKKGKLGTTDSIQDIAQEELGMVNPDTVFVGEK